MAHNTIFCTFATASETEKQAVHSFNVGRCKFNLLIKNNMEDKIKATTLNVQELDNATESVASEETLNKKGGEEIERLRQRYNFNAISSYSNAKYANDEAHAELKSMMERGERLSLYFTIDSYGMEAISVESKTTSRFNYQLNTKSFTWIMKYLTSKEIEDFEVNPTDVKEAEIQNADAFRHDMLLIFINNEMGRIQFTPEFRDRTGKLSATANFPYGQIFFFMERDKELVEYLRAKNLIR